MNDEKKLRVILYTMILTTIMVSIYGVFDYLIDVRPSIPGWERWDHRANFPFGCPNALACYVNLSIPVVISMLIAGVLLRERIVLGFCAVLSTVTCFLTISRTGWLTFFLALIIVFILTKQKKRVAAYLVVFLLVSIIIFFSFSMKDSSRDRDFTMDRLTLQTALEGLGGRAECYSIGFKMVKDDLVFGIGTGNYSILIKKFTTVRQFVQNNLHNLYLQIFIETGLVGLCAFVFWLTGILRFILSSLKSLENSRNYGLYIGLIGGVIAYLFANFVNVLTVHGIHLQWGIILGLAVVLTQSRESETCPKAA